MFQDWAAKLFDIEVQIGRTGVKFSTQAFLHARAGYTGSLDIGGGSESSSNLSFSFRLEGVYQGRERHCLKIKIGIVVVARHSEIEIGPRGYRRAIERKFYRLEYNPSAINLRNGLKVGDFDFSQIKTGDVQFGGEVAQRQVQRV